MSNIIRVIVSNYNTMDAVVSALADERIACRQAKEVVDVSPPGCQNNFVMISEGDDDCKIGLAEFLATEIPDLLYCGPEHPREKSCIGNKIVKLKRDYVVVVAMSSKQPGPGDDVTELIVNP